MKMTEKKSVQKGFSPSKPPAKPDKGGDAGYSPSKPPVKPKK